MNRVTSTTLRPNRLDRFLPDHVQASGKVGDILTARLAVSVATVFVVVGTVAAVMFPPHLMGELSWAGTIVTNIIALSIPFRIRRGASVPSCIQQLTGSLVVVLTIVSAQQGGSASPSTIWLALFPYLAFALGGRRSGSIVGGMSFTALMFLLLGARFDLFPEPRIDMDPAIIATCITTMFGIILIIVAQASARIRNAVEQDLHLANQGLSYEVSDHKQTQGRLEVTHRELVDVARIAGAAEVATGILHNLGNALTAVNVCAGLADTEAAGMDLQRLDKIASLVSTSGDGRAARYVAAVQRDLNTRRTKLREEVGALRNAVEHASAIVATQQRHAVRTSVTERVTLQEFVSDAVTLSTSSSSSTVRVDVCCTGVPDIFVDRHRLMQIVTNLLTNAHDAVEGTSAPRIDVRATVQDDRIELRVSDNGIGIAEQSIEGVFAHGFTTKPTGHGFGLHASALAATELGGSLYVESAGLGHGATFVLHIPVTLADSASGSESKPVEQRETFHRRWMQR